jgi:hypothetical protein
LTAIDEVDSQDWGCGKWRIMRGEKTASHFLSPNFPLAPQRLSERKDSHKDSQLVIWPFVGCFLDSQQGHLAQDPKLFGKSLFSSQFVPTPALSSQTMKGVWSHELRVCCHPNKHRNVICNMKYAKIENIREGPAGRAWV